MSYVIYYKKVRYIYHILNYYFNKREFLRGGQKYAQPYYSGPCSSLCMASGKTVFGIQFGSYSGH